MKTHYLKSFVVAVLSIMFFTSCGSTENSSALLNADSTDFFYPAENVAAFDVSSDGTLYTIEGETEFNICSYDLNGERNQLFSIENPSKAIACADGKLYYAQESDNGIDIFCFDTDLKQIADKYSLNNIYEVKNLEITGENAYILGIDPLRQGMAGTYRDQFGYYSYNGEKLIKISLDSGEISESTVEFPQAFSALDGNVTVYAADEDGHYFTDFEGSNKAYNDVGNITSMELYEKDKFIFYSDSIILKLSSATTSHEDGMAEVLEDVIILGGNDIKYEGGFGFVLNKFDYENAAIMRFKTSEYIKLNNKIRFISAEYSFDEPFGCGYVIEQNELDDETFSLTVLSQDSSYDMCIINSAQDYAANIRSKGSFYPLNEIDGVNEYLDKCFPYVKQAAITEQGEIWMLPVLLNAGAVIYNPENCQEAGIELTDNMLISDFIGQCEKAESSTFDGDFSAHCYELTQNMLFDYLSYHESFDSDLFRSFAEFAKEKMNITSFPTYLPINNNAANSFMFNGADNFLFDYTRKCSIQTGYKSYDFLRAYPAPKLEQSTKNTVTCAFITVNPSSANLESTLDYISSLSRYLGSQQNSLVLSDKSMYNDTSYMSDLYSIYENGEICFNVSSEIIFDDYFKFCSGEITLDSLITEADRKYSAYLNE